MVNPNPIAKEMLKLGAYRKFASEVRELTRHAESMQTPKSEGGFGDECVLSPVDLRNSLRELDSTLREIGKS